MNDLISQLKKYALEDYPIPLVTEFLNDYKLSDQELKDYLHFKDNKYARNLVYKNKDFEILIVCWHPEQIAPIHGHEGEKCWMRVEVGSLNICNYKLESIDPLSLSMVNQIKGDAGFLDGPAEIHSVKNIFDEDAISLHVYAKPFSECDIYNLDTGKIDRVELAYDSIDKQLC